MRKTPPQVLISFVGVQDPHSGKQETPLSGPILSFAAAKRFDRFTLFHTSDAASKQRGQACATSLVQAHPGATIHLIELDFDDPSDHELILERVRRHLPEIRRSNDQCELYVSLSSGTPAMHACWLLLAASGEIPANVVYIPHSTFVGDRGKPYREINPRNTTFPMILPFSSLEEIHLPDEYEIKQAVAECGIIGQSRKLTDALKLATWYAPHDSSVLILGENGVGKELFAKYIHRISKRKDKEFVALNCGAIASTLIESELFGYVKGAFTGAVSPKLGRFTQAHGGTLFLDEIGEMSPEVQVKVLRVLQEGEVIPVGATTATKVDVRVIAATNRNLAEAVKRKEFREDLFHRLDVLNVTLPPLRERSEDILLLTEYFLKKHNDKNASSKIVADAAIEKLKAHEWTGNVRELANTIERAFVTSRGGTIEAAAITFSLASSAPVDADITHLPKLGEEGFKLKDHLDSIRDALYNRALDAADSKAEAARLLGVTPPSVNKFVKSRKQS